MPWKPDYATLAEGKAYLRIDDDLDNAEIQTALTTASRNLDRFANRQFGNLSTPVARYYTACWDRERSLWTVGVDDLHSVVDIEVAFDAAGDGTYTTEVTTFIPEPLNAAADGRPWESLRLPRSGAVSVSDAPGAFRVTSAGFGWASVPVPIKEATLLQMSRYFSRRNAPFGIAGSPEIGSEMRLLNKLDPDVEVAVGPYRRVWGAV